MSHQAHSHEPTTLEDRLSETLRAWGDHVGLDPQPAQVSAVLWPSHVGCDATSFVLGNGQGASAFLKLYRPSEIDIGRAALATARAGEMGISPRLLGHLPVTGALLQQCLPPGWSHMTLADADSPETRAHLVERLRDWHKGPPLGWKAARPATFTLPIARPGIPAEYWLEGWNGASQWVERISAGLAATGHDVCPVHGDAYLSNVMIGPGNAMMLVDFDHAGDGDPLMDVAILCLELCELDEEYESIVEIYAQRVVRNMMSRVRLYAILEDYHWANLALVRHFGAAESDVDFLFYARMRAMRCIQHLRLWDVDMLIRSA